MGAKTDGYKLMYIQLPNPHIQQAGRQGQLLFFRQQLHWHSVASKQPVYKVSDYQKGDGCIFSQSPVEFPEKN